MRRITIKDIAKLVGVNPSTVSRALKDHPDISTSMKAKIQQVAEELGYFPNIQAINFRNRQSKLMAFILPEIGRFFMPDMVRAMEEMASKKGYSFIVFQSNDFLRREKECIRLCQSFGVDGLMVSLSQETATLDHFNAFARQSVPVVFVDKVLKDDRYSRVCINDYTTAFTAVQHLAKRNYKKIAGLFASDSLSFTQQRKKGYLAALQEYGLLQEDRFCLHFTAVQEMREAITGLLKLPNPPDAIFSISDEILSVLMQIVYELNLRVPEDIAIISISNGFLPYYCNPKITHIKHSGYQVGKDAANLLLDLMEAASVISPQLIEIETFLVELDSC